MNQEKILDIYPISKFKRFLAFLGDILINYILAVTIFELVVFNIGTKITNYYEINEDTNNNVKYRYDILYSNNLLYYKDDEKYNFDNNLNSTFEYFLKAYVKDINPNNDPIYYYFINLSHNENSKEEMFNKYQELGSNFFNIESNQISLKEEYVTYFLPYFDVNDSLSALGNQYLNTFKKSVYTALYNFMIKDISIYDLSYDNHSYIECTNTINHNNEYQIKFNSISVSISFIISFLITYVLIPLLFKDRNTITYRVMKMKRINTSNYKFIKRNHYIVIILNNFIMSLSTLFFVGILNVSFTELFRHTYLLFISLISFGYVLINLFVLLFNKYNRTLNELSTNSMVIDQDSLNLIYQEKGYEK